MNKKCQNCAYLRYKEEYLHYNQDGLYGSDTFWCDLHDVKVHYPEEQFCGEEYWLSITTKQRIDKLEQLGI